MTIERIKQFGRHVADEATVTADVLNDAVTLLTEAKEHIDRLCEEYLKTLRANGYTEATDSIRAAYNFRWNKL